jgi:hypothetical protein
MRVRWLFLILFTFFQATGCKPMQETSTQEISITATTVGKVNGISVAVGGPYQDVDGAMKINMTINRVVHPGMQVGDTFAAGDQTWRVKALEKAVGKQKGAVVLEKN